MNLEKFKKEKLYEPRLDSYSLVLRHGSKQIFYKKHSPFVSGQPVRGDGKRKLKPDSIVVLPPKESYFAALIDGDWWWVEGCPECNGQKRSWSTYIECSEHNVCRDCGEASSDASRPLWAQRDGWQCNDCYWIEKNLVRQEALRCFDESSFVEGSYVDLDGEVLCPYCGEEHYYEFDGDLQIDDQQCDVCLHTFALSAKERGGDVLFTSRRIEEKELSDYEPE